MAHKFAALAFTPAVKAQQELNGSRQAYARMELGQDHHDRLGPQEAGFIAARDSFYMATVGSTGWPYIQHRGGPAGFVRVLDDATPLPNTAETDNTSPLAICRRTTALRCSSWTIPIARG
jgi:uncharacterized protein